MVKSTGTLPVLKTYNQIRGLSPFPGAFAVFKDKSMKILRARYDNEDKVFDPGKMETDGKTWLRFSGPDGYIYVEELQLEGRKECRWLSS